MFVKARVHWADLCPVRLFWRVLSARVNRLSDGKGLTVSAGRLAKNPCSRRQFLFQIRLSDCQGGIVGMNPSFVGWKIRMSLLIALKIIFGKFIIDTKLYISYNIKLFKSDCLYISRIWKTLYQVWILFTSCTLYIYHPIIAVNVA